ncbi:futalosine hydrolase [Parapedobacter sp. DT-150]|uniref:futalosine hydrolase n=1 Tax=Parapedobacter sp. DT-150 TaxID=3396162 RepID=UPI003F196A84
MDILVIAATQEEIRPFLRLPEQQRQGMDILITGVGMVATAFAIGQKLATDHYDLLLNVGIAGSFDRAIPLGEVVWIVQDTLAELGAEDGDQFLDSDTLGLADHTFHSPTAIAHPILGELRRCRGITVNTVHGNQHRIDAVVNRLNPDTESMEGAAVCYAAHRSGIPAIQVRAISNYVERRHKASWKIPLAIENLNRWLGAFAGSANR